MGLAGVWTAMAADLILRGVLVRPALAQREMEDHLRAGTGRGPALNAPGSLQQPLHILRQGELPGKGRPRDGMAQGEAGGVERRTGNEARSSVP